MGIDYTTYRKHNCTSTHRTWRTLARCVWGDRYIEPDTPWFAVLPGGAVVMCATEDAARVLGRVIRLAEDREPTVAPSAVAPAPSPNPPASRRPGAADQARAVLAIVVLVLLVAAAVVTCLIGVRSG